MHSRLLSILTGLLVSLSLMAQKIPFTNYTVKNGLPSNVVYDIEQDQQGYLWFGTQAGAVRFDGYHFITYDVNSGLPGNTVKDIFIDHEGKVWMGTKNNGLAILSGNGQSITIPESKLVSNNILFLFQDKLEKIWCICKEGISVIGTNSVDNYTHQNSPFKNQILDYFVAANGTVFLSSLDGLFYYADSAFLPYLPEKLGYLLVYDMAEDQPGSYWLATQNKGVVNIDRDEKIRFYNQSNGLHTHEVYSLCVTQPGLVYAGTDRGCIYRIANHTLQKCWTDPKKDFLAHALLCDKNGRIWIKTVSKGVAMIRHDELEFIDESNNLVFDKPNKLFEDRNGNIWIATWNGISMYGKTIFQQYNTNLLHNDNNIISIEWSENTVFLGSYGGYNCILPDLTVQQHTIANQSGTATAVYSILHQNKQTTYMGLTGGMASINDKGQLKASFPEAMYTRNYPSSAFDLAWVREQLYAATEHGLIVKNHTDYRLLKNPDTQFNSLYSLAADSSGNLWCGSANGLAVYDGTEFHNFTTQDGLPDNFCNDIAFDTAWNAWIATDNGIAKATVDPGWQLHCQSYGVKEGLTSGLTLLITEDKKHNIWIGHNKGLDKFNPAAKTFTPYGRAEGFIPIETYMGAVSLGKNGEIWFGTVDGAMRYLPDNDYTYTDPPLVYITDIQLYGDSVPIRNLADSMSQETNLPVGLTLKYNQNNLVFHYVGLHYTIVEKNRYKYILEGYDADWSEITPEISTPPYRKLPHGKYTFKVLAANCDGVWTTQPASFSFEIRPPFWKTLGFYILEVLLGMGLVWLVMYLRVRKLKADKILLTQKVKERTQEIEKQRDQIALQKKEITDSIHYAEKIQQAVLPRDTLVAEILSDYFILFKPRDIVSGDFYWVHNHPDKIVVVAADCTGHGVPGAFMSMLGVSILNEIASGKILPPANRILDLLREHLTQTLRQTGEEGEAKDGMDLSMVILDKTASKAQFAGAYNPLIHVRQQEATVYKADKMPVGFHFGEMAPFASQDIEVQTGDCLYMFSDGYADQFGGPEGKKFKSANLRNLLCEVSPLPMNRQKEILDNTITEWMHQHEQIDDILVIGIRV